MRDAPYDFEKENSMHGNKSNRDAYKTLASSGKKDEAGGSSISPSSPKLGSNLGSNFESENGYNRNQSLVNQLPPEKSFGRRTIEEIDDKYTARIGQPEPPEAKELPRTVNRESDDSSKFNLINRHPKTNQEPPNLGASNLINKHQQADQQRKFYSIEATTNLVNHYKPENDSDEFVIEFTGNNDAPQTMHNASTGLAIVPKNEGVLTKRVADNKLEAHNASGNLPLAIPEAKINDPFGSIPKRRTKIERKEEKGEALLKSDNWLSTSGHNLTYIGLFLFTFVLYFRPYDWSPELKVFSSMAMILAVFTLVIYLPTQLSAENSITILTTEVKGILAMALIALLLIPISRNAGVAWDKFSDPFIKVVMMFVVMVNVIRTRKRIMGLVWLAMAVGTSICVDVIGKYNRGEFQVEGYRVKADMNGMFGNPNDLAIHLVILIPIAIVLGVSTRNYIAKLGYFALACLFIAGSMVVQSRGAFLAIIISSSVLLWKLSKKNRIRTMAVAAVVGLAFIAVAPGNYGIRILSIFIPSLDPVGSSHERSELLKFSLLVTARNPWGIGIGNFPIVSPHNMETHNAYTQVSSELGILGLIGYLAVLVTPIRKLGAMERQLNKSEDTSWMYYLSIGLQCGIIAYMVASFFGPVAYQWYVYYPVAYAICLRRIFQIGKKLPVGPEGKTAANVPSWST